VPKATSRELDEDGVAGVEYKRWRRFGGRQNGIFLEHDASVNVSGLESMRRT
jgi:hypothetical protein